MSTLILTEAEIAIIEKKRAEEKQAQKSKYEQYVERQISFAKDRAISEAAQADALKNLYEKLYGQIVAVNPDFKLVAVKTDKTIVAQAYDFDEEGQVIYRIDGQRVEAKVVANIPSYYYSELAIEYTGKLPEKYKFFISVESKSIRNNDYKMVINGTNISTYGRRPKYTKVSTVIKEVLEHAAGAFKRVENEKYQNDKQARFDKHFEETYGMLQGAKRKTMESTYEIKYESGLKLTFSLYELNNEIKGYG